MIIKNKYKLESRIGSGAFGAIYKAIHLRTNEAVAIKVEKGGREISMLQREAKIYVHIRMSEFVPKVKWFGSEYGYNFMAMELLGEPLSQRRPREDVLSIGKQLITLVKSLHDLNFIHSDIKPDNFVYSVDGNQLYLIDYGLCRKYVGADGKHVEQKCLQGIVGSLNYCSINIHNLCSPSRRDDMESIGYVMLFLYLNRLSWAEIGSAKLVQEAKRNFVLNHTNSDGYSVIRKIALYIKYCMNLSFREKPSYAYMMSLLD